MVLFTGGNANMATTPREFRDHIIEAGVLDREGVHHQFARGMHGRKLDFEKIPDDSDLLEEWAEVGALSIQSQYAVREYGKLVILSVAEGTNRVVPLIAEKLGTKATALLTEKVSATTVRLSVEAQTEITDINPDLTVVFDDTGTTGSNSATAIIAARLAGAKEVVAMNTWQRRETLEELDKIGADYSAIIYEPLPTYTLEDCFNLGYCAMGWEYIPYAI
jgi:phosphoribosylpyrophosphate synthetase